MHEHIGERSFEPNVAIHNSTLSQQRWIVSLIPRTLLFSSSLSSFILRMPLSPSSTLASPSSPSRRVTLPSHTTPIHFNLHAIGENGTLSNLHLKQTYLQQFRLISPANANPQPSLLASSRPPPPLLQSHVAHSNALGQKRVKRQQVEAERFRTHQRSKAEQEAVQRQQAHLRLHQQYSHPNSHPNPPSHPHSRSTSLQLTHQNHHATPHHPSQRSSQASTFSHTQPIHPYHAPSSAYSSAFAGSSSHHGTPSHFAPSRPYTSPNMGSASALQSNGMTSMSEFDEKEGNSRPPSTTMMTVHRPVTPAQLPPLNRQLSNNSNANGDGLLSSQERTNGVGRPNSASNSDAASTAMAATQPSTFAYTSPLQTASLIDAPAVSLNPSDAWLIRRTAVGTAAAAAANLTLSTPRSGASIPVLPTKGSDSTNKSYTLRRAPGSKLLEDIAFPTAHVEPHVQSTPAPPPPATSTSSIGSSLLHRVKRGVHDDFATGLSRLLMSPPKSSHPGLAPPHHTSREVPHHRSVHSLAYTPNVYGRPSSRPQQPTDTSKTIFDTDELLEGELEDETVQEWMAQQPVLGFKPHVEDVMDLYFFLSDPTCPIFRLPPTTSTSSSTSSATNANPSSPSLVASPPPNNLRQSSTAHGSGAPSPSSKRLWSPYSSHNTSLPSSVAASAAGAIDDSYDDDILRSSSSRNPGRYVPPPAYSELASRVGMDLPHLAALREAAGGSVQFALGYLSQLCPSQVALIHDGTQLRVLPTSSNSGPRALAQFDPFTHMDELIQTVRGMYERDKEAGIQPPTMKIYHQHQSGSHANHSNLSSFVTSHPPSHPSHRSTVDSPSASVSSSSVSTSMADLDRDEAQEARLIARELLAFQPEKRPQSKFPMQQDTGYRMTRDQQTSATQTEESTIQ